LTVFTHQMRSEVHTMVTTNIAVFWNVTLLSLTEGYWCCRTPSIRWSYPSEQHSSNISIL